MRWGRRGREPLRRAAVERRPSPYCVGGGEAGGLELNLMAGVARHGVRTVQLSFKVTVKHIHWPDASR